MRVVDTSIWIEWLVDGPLRGSLTKEFPAKAQCVVPTIVQLELAKWLAREAGEDQVDQVIAFTEKCVVVPLDTRIALLAAELHRQYKLATADAVVYATARQHGADLLTCDAHFERLPNVVLLRKRA
jgi:predicted nucleic acid-binding protein